MVSEETKLEVLHDHYKDSFSYIREYIGIRDRLLPYILVTLTILLSQLFSPEETGKNISDFISKKLELTETIDIGFIGSIIWFGLLALIVRYYQTVIYIEGQYNYLQKIEEELSKYYPNTYCFTREGKEYSKNYPLFSKWSYFIYRYLFPFLLIIVAVLKIGQEWFDIKDSYLIPAINTIIASSIVCSTYFYMKTIYSNGIQKFFEQFWKR